ncbi:hypothetical protein ACLMJK_000129 [Lecanora helva]
MHLSILFILSAGAMTLASPWNTKTKSTKRFPPPVHQSSNIAAYDFEGTCQVLTGPQLDLKIGKCVQIGPTPKQNLMGMDFACFDILHGYSDSNCKHETATIPAPSLPMFPSLSDAAELCLRPVDFGGSVWKSVMVIQNSTLWREIKNQGGGPGSPVANKEPGQPYKFPGVKC